MAGSTTPVVDWNRTKSRETCFGLALYAKNGYALIRKGDPVFEWKSRILVTHGTRSWRKEPAEGGYEVSRIAKEWAVVTVTCYTMGSKFHAKKRKDLNDRICFEFFAVYHQRTWSNMEPLHPNKQLKDVMFKSRLR